MEDHRLYLENEILYYPSYPNNSMLIDEDAPSQGSPIDMYSILEDR
jgi:hypothetical protein